MTIRHHIEDDLLLDYASGALEDGWSLAVATHLALCPACRRRLDQMERIGAAVFEATAVPAAGDDGWAAMQRKLAGPAASRAPDAAAPPPIPRPGTTPILPEPLRSRAGGDAASLRWRSLPGGSAQIKLPSRDGTTQIRLLRVPAGAAMPEHGHGGRELTLVLCGSFTDSTGTYRRGDLESADAELDHQPIVGPEEDCICLAVTDAPLRFRSRLVRLLQPLLGL